MRARNTLIPFVMVAVVGLSACTTQMVQNKEDHLAAAGFIDKPANTPARAAMLAKLPPNQFVRRTKGDKVAYVYADPKVCNCLYVGNQKAYGRYTAYMQKQNLADERQMTAMDYQDANWDWGGWGGDWGGYWGPGFWGPGMGW